MTRFAENENASEAAALVNAHLDAVETESDRAKALTDLVIKVKKHALERMKDADDGRDPLKKAMEEKKALKQLKDIRISI